MAQVKPSILAAIPTDVLECTKQILCPFEKCKLSSYWDNIGKKWTIGWGCTGSEIHKGLTWNQTKADLELSKRLADAYSSLVHYSPKLVLEHFKRQAAILDFVYNCGIGTYAHSTHLKTYVDRGEWAEVEKILAQYDHGAQGKEELGLKRRRAAEIARLKEVES